ncbi:MAG: hypothetical protein ACTSUP_01185 [Candidatus Heimdallarchaeaceae archaeon]
MSKQIPRRTIDALRKQVNVSLDNYGISCSLYIPNNLDETETFDIYQTPSDYTYDHYTTKVFIEWNPNIYRLKAKGLHVDGELPIIVRFPYEATDDDGNIVDVDILRHSYFGIEPEYIPENYEGIEEFELVDIMLDKFHDAVVVKSFKAVPRRYQDISG